MIALLLALAAPAQPIRLACTHEQSGRIVQGRVGRRAILIREGRRSRALPARQATWSCMPIDPRVRLPIDRD